MSTTIEVLLLIIITLISPSFSSGFGINLMEVPAEDHSQVICTSALLKKYFHYGVPLSGSLLSMSITSAAIQIQQSLLRAIHTDETYPWSVIVKHARHETPITSAMLVVHEKPQCYFVVIENLEDEDLEDMFEDWRTTINWNPLAQFVVYLASVEETDEEMTELMIEILLYFMNIKIYNVNVIGQNEENGFYYGKTVFPYHPDNNCGNRVIAIETLDICDYHETSRDEEEDEETDDYDEGGEQDTDENEEGTDEDDNENGAEDNGGGENDDGTDDIENGAGDDGEGAVVDEEGVDEKEDGEDDNENGADDNEKGTDDNEEGVGDDGEGEGVNAEGVDDKDADDKNGEDDNEEGINDNEEGVGNDGENGADDNENGAGENKKGVDDDEEGAVVNKKGVDDENGAEDIGGGEDNDGTDDNENGAGDEEEAKDDNEKGTDVNEKDEVGVGDKNEAGNDKEDNTNDTEDGGKDIEKDYNEVVADDNEEGRDENQEDGDDNEENLDDNEADVNEYKQVKRNVVNNDNNPIENTDDEIQSKNVKMKSNDKFEPLTKRKKSQNMRKRRKRQMSATEEKPNATEPTAKIYLEELYRALFLDKFPKDLSGCPLVAAYRPYEPYIFSEDYTKNDENYEDAEYTEASNTDTDEYGGNDAYNDENTHGSKLTGIEYKMIQTIAERLHISIDIQVDNKNLYHLFQQLIDGDVEMIVGGVDEDPSISQYVSSTIPYHQDDLTWCVAKAKQSHNLFNFLTSFRMETWALTLTFVLASALAIVFIQKTLKVQISNLQGYFTVATLIYGVILSQAMQLKRSPSALKICLGTAFFMSLMFSNIYQSFLISTLTTPKNSYQISHLHEIYSNRMSIMGSVDNVRHLNKDGEIFKYIREKFQMCYDIEECLIRAANDDRIAVAVSRQHTFYNPRIPRDQLYCFNRDENIYVYLVTLLLPKKFHLLHRINPIIQHVIESGHMQKWARDLDMKRKIKEEVNRVREDPVKKITLSQVGGIFVFGAILLVFAFLVFIAECWVHWMVSKRRTRLKLAKILHKHFK